MNHSRKLNTHRQEASKTDTVDTDAYDRKIQSLLDTNRLLARENQFLSQQSDMLRKEHDALGHLMRSRIALSNVKEMELKSALEGMRIVVQEKEKVTVSLERKYNDLLERMKSFESSGVEEKKQTNVTPASCRIRRLSRQFTDVSPGEEHAGSHAQSLEGMTEAFHPWLSPVLMRLETLEKEHGASLQGLCRTDFAPMAELQETISAPDSLQFCGLDDAISCTGDRQTTVQTLGEADDQRSPIQEEKKIEAESQYRIDQNNSLHTPVSGIRSSLRRRKSVINYALPSVKSKLRQGDPNTFGNAYETPKSRKAPASVMKSQQMK